MAAFLPVAAASSGGRRCLPRPTRYRAGIAAVDGRSDSAVDSRGMGIAVLGPLQVDGRANGLSPQGPGGPRRRSSCAPASRSAPRRSPTRCGGRTSPASWAKVVQGCVVRLRKRLGTAAIESGPSGYRLALSDDELDHRRVRAAARARRGRRWPAATRSARRTSPGRRSTLWRGRALADLDEWEPGRVEAERLEGLRMDAEELLRGGRDRRRARAGRCWSGRGRWWRRRRSGSGAGRCWPRRCYQAGRQAEALGAVQRARAMLVDELGLDPGPELVELEQRLLRQDPSLTPPVDARGQRRSAPTEGCCPYGAEDADSFFGREDDVAACLRRLRDSGVLAVVGPSGVGKSSLVRAGVVASLVRGGTPVLVTTPGVHPMDSLARVEAARPADPGGGPGRGGGHRSAPTPASGSGTSPRWPRTWARAARWCSSLRADHLGDLAPYPDIARVLEDGLYLLGPMSEPDLRSAIEGPARRAGLRLEPGLVDLLVREVEGEPGRAAAALARAARDLGTARGPDPDRRRATGPPAGSGTPSPQSAESLYDAMDDAAARPAARPAAAAGDAHRGRRPGPRPGAPRQGRRRRRPRPARRAAGRGAGWSASTATRSRSRTRRWCGSGRGCAAGSTTTSTASACSGTSPAPPTPGTPWAARTASSTAAPGWPRRSSGASQAAPDLTATERAFLDSRTRARTGRGARPPPQQAQRQRSVNRRLRGLLACVVACLLVAALVAGGLAARQADRAADATRVAEARRVATLSQLTDRTDQSLRLALAAAQRGRLTRDRSPACCRHCRAVPSSPASHPPWTRLSPTSTSTRSRGEAAGMDRAGGCTCTTTPALAPIATFDPHPPGWRTQVFCVCDPVTFSPDGETLAVGVPIPTDPPVRLLDAQTLRPLRRQLGGQPGRLCRTAPVSAPTAGTSRSRTSETTRAALRWWSSGTSRPPMHRSGGSFPRATGSCHDLPRRSSPIVVQAWNSALPAFPARSSKCRDGPAGRLLSRALGQLPAESRRLEGRLRPGRGRGADRHRRRVRRPAG